MNAGSDCRITNRQIASCYKHIISDNSFFLDLLLYYFQKILYYKYFHILSVCCVYQYVLVIEYCN